MTNLLTVKKIFRQINCLLKTFLVSRNFCLKVCEISQKIPFREITFHSQVKKCVVTFTLISRNFLHFHYFHNFSITQNLREIKFSGF